MGKRPAACCNWWRSARPALLIGLRPEQIIADFTGGTTPMSVGVALACRERWPMQYTTGGRLDEVVSVPIAVRFKPAEAAP